MVYKPCREPGCPAYAVEDKGYCEKHMPPPKPRRRARSRSYKYLYDTAYWRNASKEYLRQHPLCEYCQDEGRLVPSAVVDHKKPHKGDRTLFFDSSNWAAACRHCHDVKTAREDGGFGNALSPEIGYGGLTMAQSVENYTDFVAACGKGEGGGSISVEKGARTRGSSAVNSRETGGEGVFFRVIETFEIT